MSKQRRWFASGIVLFAAAFTALVSGIALSGCGGGGGNDSRDTDGLVNGTEESRFTTSALIVASRETPDVAIPTATVASINADLAAIRKRYPQVAAIDARPEDALKSVVGVASFDSVVGRAWLKGQVTTGIADIDAVLRKYKTTSVKFVGSKPNYPSFLLGFADPINTRKVREALSSLAAPDTSGLIGVYSYGISGFGAGGFNENITRTTSGTNRVYTFSRGYGDCPSGCIGLAKWIVTIGADNSFALEESGLPPDGDFNRSR